MKQSYRVSLSGVHNLKPLVPRGTRQLTHGVSPGGVPRETKLYRVSPVDLHKPRTTGSTWNDRSTQFRQRHRLSFASHRQQSGQNAGVLTVAQFATPNTFHVKPSNLLHAKTRADYDKSCSGDLGRRQITCCLSGFWCGGGIEVPRGTRTCTPPKNFLRI